MSTLAERARAAARDHPFLLATLRAGACNYAAAARFLDVAEDEQAVATALRRYAADLPDYETADRDPRVTMESGLGAVDGTRDDSGDGDDALLRVAGTGYAPDAGSLTGMLATGDVDARALAWTLDRLDAAGVAVEAAGVAGDGLLVVVERRAGPDTLRVVERALAAVPTSATDADT